jgi:hypothetical protein
MPIARFDKQEIFYLLELRGWGRQSSGNKQEKFNEM